MAAASIVGAWKLFAWENRTAGGLVPQLRCAARALGGGWTIGGS